MTFANKIRNDCHLANAKTARFFPQSDPDILGIETSFPWLSKQKSARFSLLPLYIPEQTKVSSLLPFSRYIYLSKQKSAPFSFLPLYIPEQTKVSSLLPSPVIYTRANKSQLASPFSLLPLYTEQFLGKIIAVWQHSKTAEFFCVPIFAIAWPLPIPHKEYVFNIKCAHCTTNHTFQYVQQ